MSETLIEVASLSPEWIRAWGLLDADMERVLITAGLDLPVLWAGIRGDARVIGLLKALGLLEGLGPDQESRIEQGLWLRDAACSAGEAWTHGIAELTDLQVSMDIDRRHRKRAAISDAQCDSQAKAIRLHGKPAVWRGKAYHRAEQAGDENARKRAETAEWERWSIKVVKILISAQLPFGIEMRDKGWGPLGHEAEQCLRGLRAATLRKRVSDRGPFLRYLRAHTGKFLFHREVRGFGLFHCAGRGARSPLGLPGPAGFAAVL